MAKQILLSSFYTDDTEFILKYQTHLERNVCVGSIEEQNLLEQVTNLESSFKKNQLIKRAYKKH